MKNNLKIRLISLLLCLATLFFASCVAPDAIDTPADTENNGEDAPAFPENGAKKIVTKTLKLYETAENFKEISVAYYEGTPEILLIDTETMRKEFIEPYMSGVGYFEYEETDTTLTIKRGNGAYCTLDFAEDSLYFSNFDTFKSTGYGNMADLLSKSYLDEEGNHIYFSRTESLAIDGLPVYIDLASRDIPLDIYEGKKYVPFQTFNDVFISPCLHSDDRFNFVYNGKDLFLSTSGSIDPSLIDEYYSIGQSERSEALIEYTINELCLLLDLFYGLQDEHGVTYGFDAFIENTGLLDDLRSPDAQKSSAALASLMYGYLADKHSAFKMPSPYTGSATFDDSGVIYHTSYTHFIDYIRMIKKVRANVFSEGVPGYQEIGNTAYITLDEFMHYTMRYEGYSEDSLERSDTMGLIIYAHSQITREGSPIENVVLDLSCNTGGIIDSALYVTAWMLGYCDFHLTNRITNSYATASYKVDVNLDGKFDENDTVSDKNLYCIISPGSFSCGNFVPALLRESGRVTLIGGASAGGACSVQFVSLADGTLFRISSSNNLCVVSNGAYYTVDRGVEPHFYITKVESYFDRDALTEHINGLK